MRVLLLQPPILRTNSAAELQANDKNTERVPIGMYSLAAVLIEAGFETRLCNHAESAWNKSQEEIVAWKPDLVGISCMSHNRSTALAMVAGLRKRLPKCRTILGGVHATFLYEGILERCPAVDFVAVGEAEVSFLELVRRLDAGDSPLGIPGIAGRTEDGSLDWVGGAPMIENLGQLPVAAKHFAYDMLSTARGCPGQCTFCCSPKLWGRSVREKPLERVIEELQWMQRHGVKQALFKDETFTLRKSRVQAVCQAMLDADLGLWWDCDTRVDCLDEERLYWMRKAGCFRINFGVESGSPAMLEGMHKKTSLEKIRETSLLARKFGMSVRYFLIVGLENETPADLQATLDLVESCKPHSITVSPLGVSPGTELFETYSKEKKLNADFWFRPETPNIVWFDPKKKWQKNKAGKALWDMSFERLKDVEKMTHGLYPLTEEELRSAQERLEDCFAPNYDLGLFLKDSGKATDAVPFYERALEIRPNFGKGWIDLGLCLDLSGQTDDAVTRWEKVEFLENEPPRNQAMAFIYRGLAAARNDLDGALALWAKARERMPHEIAPLRLIAEKCAASGRWDDAVEAAEQWVALDANAGEAWHIVALASTVEGANEDAQTLFDKALQLSPQNPEIYCNYAMLMARSGCVEDAVKLLNSSLRIAPDYTRAQELLQRLEVPPSAT